MLGHPRGQQGVYAGQPLNLRGAAASPTYAPFVAALAREVAASSPTARFTVPAVATQGVAVGGAALLGGGALALAAFSIGVGQMDLGLALAARMAFLAIMVLAILPWIDLTAGQFDPHAVPARLVSA